MTDALHPDNTQPLNPSGNASIRDVMAVFSGRRQFLQGGLGTALLTMFGQQPVLAKSASTAPQPQVGRAGQPLIGFASAPANLATDFADQVTVPKGYTARVLLAWGDALGQRGPAARQHWDARDPMTEVLQLSTWGSHNDGMHFFPMAAVTGNKPKQRPKAIDQGVHGLLVANHEYIDPGLLLNTSTYGTDPIAAAKVGVQLAAHGISVVALHQVRGQVQVKRPSPYARRITGSTPCRISGPAAGHPLLKTAADPHGVRVLGTLNNCANGFTPWGTYLTCEENFNSCFGTQAAKLAAEPLTAHEKRYGLKAESPYRWHEVDARFDIRSTPHEANRFGWVVEIDPWNPKAMPIKRTALGRFKHESATHVVGPDQRVAVYMGDDERNDYVYKFVCKRRFKPGHRTANHDLLDDGTLYVARFSPDGQGLWLPLIWGQGKLTPDNGFADQGEVLIKARQAADLLGATMMDRPEWVAVHPHTREVYVTLTNNDKRGSSAAPVDAANPRQDNRYGHILRWREAGDDVAATTFSWDIFIQCGDKRDPDAHHQGNIQGDDLGAPDGLWFDRDGRLWIQTDQEGEGRGDWANIGGNLMACADPVTRQVKRFLTGPRKCEVTGITNSPDGRVMFVGIQHPGEGWSGSYTSKSSWPDNGANGPTTQQAVAKPRSAVVVITKDDGGVIGT